MKTETKTQLARHLEAIQAGISGIAAIVQAEPISENAPPPTPAPADPPQPPIQKLPYLLAPDDITIPHERDAETCFGPADPKGGYLDWFQFPVDDIRLYSRQGDHLRDRNEDGRDEHRCHREIRVFLENALLCLFHTLGEERFYAEGWHVYSGCFNYRKKKLGGTLSMHALGIAVDFNDGENPLHSKTTSFSDEGVDIMERYGFLWGPRAWGLPGFDSDGLGLFVDPMHFQFAIPHLDSESWYARNGLPAHIQAWAPGRTEK